MICGGLLRRDRARVGELAEIGPVLFEVPDRFVRADEDDDQLAPFVALADR